MVVRYLSLIWEVENKTISRNDDPVEWSKSYKKDKNGDIEIIYTGLRPGEKLLKKFD